MNSSPSKIGILMPTWVGDACMATPTLLAVRQAFPGSDIRAIARPVIADLLAGLETPAAGKLIDGCIEYQKHGTVNRLKLAWQLRQARLDAVLLLTNSLWSAAIVRMAGVRQRVGYDRDARGWLLTDRVPVPMDADGPAVISPVDYYLRLAQWVGAEPASREMRLHVATEDIEAADGLWAQLDWSAETPTLVMNNNAATDSTRMWPADRLLELAKAVVAEKDWNVLLHCGPGEREMANAIAQRAEDSRIASMGNLADLPIGLSKAVLKRATVVLSSDSGPRHMAVALNRPVVSLFGATHPEWTRTYNVPEIAISATTSQAAMGNAALDQPASMQRISVNQVMAAINKIITREKLAA